MSALSKDQWYLEGQEDQSPLSTDELYKRLKAGQIHAHTRVTQRPQQGEYISVIDAIKSADPTYSLLQTIQFVKEKKKDSGTQKPVSSEGFEKSVTPAPRNRPPKGPTPAWITRGVPLAGLVTCLIVAWAIFGPKKGSDPSNPSHLAREPAAKSKPSDAPEQKPNPADAAARAPSPPPPSETPTTNTPQAETPTEGPTEAISGNTSENYPQTSEPYNEENRNPASENPEPPRQDNPEPQETHPEEPPPLPPPVSDGT